MNGELINITQDGKVTKKILKEGESDMLPFKGQEVEGKY